MIQVSEHHAVLYELDTQILILNKMFCLSWKNYSSMFTVAIITDICTSTTRFTTQLFNLLIVPLDELRNTLVHIKQDLKMSPRIQLQEDQDKNI